jgi:SSS family solute:Na+ symporter
MVGGVTKYLMAIIIIVPGIALFGILGENGLADPDSTFPLSGGHLSPRRS